MCTHRMLATHDAVDLVENLSYLERHQQNSKKDMGPMYASSGEAMLSKHLLMKDHVIVDSSGAGRDARQPIALDPSKTSPELR